MENSLSVELYFGAIGDQEVEVTYRTIGQYFPGDRETPEEKPYIELLRAEVHLDGNECNVLDMLSEEDKQSILDRLSDEEV